MGFLTTRFPDLIARGATGGHAFFDTTIVEVQSGHEVAISNWSASRGRWNVSQGIKIKRDDNTVVTDPRRYEAARDFLYMARGRLHRFRFKDWADYRCQRAHGRLVQITSTTFQISKVYGSEVAFEYVRSLTRPVTGTIQIWLDGVLQSSPANYTVNVDTGVVTFGSAPGAAVREVACEFDVPARFDTDRIDARLLHRKGDGTMFLEWDSIDIVEVRE